MNGRPARAEREDRESPPAPQPPRRRRRGQVLRWMAPEASAWQPGVADGLRSGLVTKDVPDGERVGDEPEDSHFAAAVGAMQRQGLVDASQHEMRFGGDAVVAIQPLDRGEQLLRAVQVALDLFRSASFPQEVLRRLVGVRKSGNDENDEQRDER